MQDDITARIRAALGGQVAPPSTHGGTRILYRCATCGRPWLMDGAQSIVRPTEAQIAQWARELGADLATLPYATCRICATQSVGEITLDEYGNGAGYGFSWEGAEPSGAHLLGSTVRLDWLQHAGATARASVITDYARCRAWLTWLAHLHAPTDGYHLLDAQDSASMAADNPPGHGAPGTEGWRWQGVLWVASCPPLDGRVCAMSLAQALPRNAPFDLGAMFACWRAIAEITLDGYIAGERQE